MLLLIDGSGILHRMYHAHSDLTRSDGLPVGALYGFCNTLWHITKGISPKPTHALVAWDMPSRKCFRHDLYHGYKAGRAVRDADLSFQFTTAREACNAFNLAQMERDGFEADDIIATLTMKAVDVGCPVRIVSSDKDLMQLVCPTVQLLRPKNGGGYEDCGIDYVIDLYGVVPHQMGDFLALVGDASDNVPGAKGIGDKKAAHLLTKYGSLEAVIDHAGEFPWPAINKSFTAQIPQVRVSRELVRLRHDVPTGNLEGTTYREPNRDLLLTFLHSMEFAKLSKEVEEALQ